MLDREPGPVGLRRLFRGRHQTERLAHLRATLAKQAAEPHGHRGVVPLRVERHAHLVAAELPVELSAGIRHFAGNRLERLRERPGLLPLQPVREGPGGTRGQRAEPGRRLREPEQLDLEVPGPPGAP